MICHHVRFRNTPPFKDLEAKYPWLISILKASYFFKKNKIYIFIIQINKVVCLIPENISISRIKIFCINEKIFLKNIEIFTFFMQDKKFSIPVNIDTGSTKDLFSLNN